MPRARKVSLEIVKEIRAGSVFFYCVYAGSAFSGRAKRPAGGASSCRAQGPAGGRLASDPAVVSKSIQRGCSMGMTEVAERNITHPNQDNLDRPRPAYLATTIFPTRTCPPDSSRAKYVPDATGLPAASRASQAMTRRPCGNA